MLLDFLGYLRPLPGLSRCAHVLPLRTADGSGRKQALHAVSAVLAPKRVTNQARRALCLRCLQTLTQHCLL